MRTNLIQSYLNGTPNVQQYNSEKAVKDFDVNKELSYRTFIKPLPSNGKLVKNTMFDMPSEFFKDMTYDWNAFKHSLKGDANDHELGRLNDFGMKAGGLAIATYLFTRKATPLTKVMEFIGLGSFFAAMDIWPKVALQLPAYLIHGVNIRQKYTDNYGRKKLFYQDPQFIPWDLISDKEINKIGNRLHVPKDIPNRRDFIQEKMKKVALQNNTMWMLTSGFATPIMSALICNALASPVSRYQNSKLNKKADLMLDNFSQEIAKVDYSNNEKSLDKILTENLNKPLTEEFLGKIHANLSEGLDFLTTGALQKDLKEMFSSVGSFDFAPETLDKVRDVLKNKFLQSGIKEEDLIKLLPSNESLNKAFSDKGLIQSGVDDFSEHSKLVQNIMQENIQKFIAGNPDAKLSKKLEFCMKQLIHNSEYGKDSELEKAFKLKPATVLTEKMISQIKYISTSLNQFKAKISVLDRFAYLKTAQAPETILANSWNGITEAMLKALQFTPEEIANCRIDREVSGSVLRSKFEKVVSDDNLYHTVIDELQKKLSVLQGKTSSLKLTNEDGKKSMYQTLVDSTFDETAESLRTSEMSNTVESLIGYEGSSSASLKDLQLGFVRDRVLGVKSSFYRLLNTLDAYHRISKVENVSQLTSRMPREVKEELVEMCKQLLIEGHTADYAVKFYSERNPNPNRSDYSQIETKLGKVINKYIETREPVNLVEMANDKEFFESAMKLMYGENLHKDTFNAINSSSFMKDFIEYRNRVLNFLGGDKYFAKPNHLVNGHEVQSSSEFKFLLLGCAPDEMFSKLCSQKFNSATWTKMFGKLGAWVLGLTLVSQLFIGHMKAPKVKKEVKK